MKTKIINLIDFEKVDILLEGFNQSTGFVTAILDLDGNVLSKSGWRQMCTEFHRINSETAKRCTISDTILAGQLAAGEKYHFYKCLNGLVDVAVPIVIKGEHIANLFSGQFFFEKPDELFFKEQAKKYGFDEDVYLSALAKVPVISEAKVKVAMEFLLNMTQLISEITFQKLEQIVLNEELRISEERYRLVLENSMDAILLSAPDGTILSANEAACAIFQRSEEDICRIGRSGIVDMSDLRLPILIEERIRTGKAKGELLMLRKDGSKFPVEISSSVFSDQSGQQRTSMIIRDITERKQTESALRLSEEKFNKAFHNSPDAIIITNVADGKIIDANETFFKLSGYERDLAIGSSSLLLNLWHNPDDRVAYVTLLKEQGSVKDFEAKFITCDKEIRDYLISGEVFALNDENCILGILHDITEHKKAEVELIKAKEEAEASEEALKKANNELEKLHNSLDEAVYSLDVIQDKIIYASIAHQAVFGYSPAEFVKNPHLWYEIIVAEDKPIFDERLSVLSTGKKLSIEYRIADPNGQIRWIEAKMNPTLDENGKLLRIDGIASDITQRKRIEVELLESEINFRRSISDSPVGIRIVTVDGKTIFTNKTFLDIYELNNLEEFTNMSTKSRYTSESYLQHEIRKERRRNGQEVYDYEISFFCSDEQIRHVKVSRKELLWNGTKHFQVINLDITEQRNAEEQLRKLSKAVEQSPDAICITNPDGVIEYVNPRTIELTGYRVEELVGQKTRIFSSGEMSRGEYAQLWQTIKSGNVWSGELHNKKKNGELYWESTTISPIFNKENQITHFLSIKEDVTERKLADLALSNSEEQLRKFASHLQNVREEEKVALAREIHDDLGQILVALKIDMGLLKQKVVKNNSFEGSEEVLGKFDNLVSLIDKTIKTARRIMNGLRPELLELNGFVGAATSYLREFEVRHQIACEFSYKTSEIELNSQQSLAFFRILQESLNNITKHSKATLVKINLKNEPNKLIFEIIDNGIGFDKNNSSRPDSYGMIGMKERVVLLEGKLEIESEIGKGTCIRVEMPYVNK